MSAFNPEQQSEAGDPHQLLAAVPEDQSKGAEKVVKVTFTPEGTIHQFIAPKDPSKVKPGDGLRDNPHYTFVSGQPTTVPAEWWENNKETLSHATAGKFDVQE